MSSLRTTEHRRPAVRAGLTYVTDAFAFGSLADMS